MRKLKYRSNEINYWESMADSLVALLLCILLIMLLLMLYLVRIEDNQMLDEQLGFSFEKYDDPDDGGGNHGYGQVDAEYGDTYDHDRDGNNGGGGGGGGAYGYGEGKDDFAYEDPDPGAGEGEGSDRAAVYVQVMDGETERTIKREGITFELYARDAVLQVLNTYYPKKISYQQYKTDSSGVFFLPERIPLDTYYFHCLTAVPGYDTGENTYFEVDQSYDWEDPLVVNIRLYPSKNVIEVQLKDVSDGRSVPGATFQVIAAENITTADGTVRYRENTVVDNITIGSDGKGRSKELFLGSYILRQSGVPEYYGKLEGDTEVALKTRTAAKKQEQVDLNAAKTSVEVTAVDELYATVPMKDIRFTLRTDAGEVVKQYTTNELGRFTLSDLKKNTTYRIHQETAAEGYQMAPEDLVFWVSGDGYVEGSVRASMEITNRTIRISVGVRDKLFRSQVSDVNLALMDAEGTILKSWNSSGMEQTIAGLSPGAYKLIVGGNQENAPTIVVEDQVELQQFYVDRWTTTDFATLIGGGAVAIGLAVLLIWLLKNKKKTKGSDM